MTQEGFTCLNIRRVDVSVLSLTCHGHGVGVFGRKCVVAVGHISVCCAAGVLDDACVGGGVGGGVKSGYGL